MNILIITTYYPPDTAIAAVRPYMFAKYLSLMGHRVTVLRSGEINTGTDTSGAYSSDAVKVYSYMGKDSPAERFAHGEVVVVPAGKSRASFLPKNLQKAAGKLYHSVFTQREFRMRMERANEKFAMQKNFLHSLKDGGSTFDVVFATFGELENVYAGEYAAKLFGCKYILDFRDLLATETFSKGKRYRTLRDIQKRAILSADVCTCVSEGASDELREQVPEKQIVTLYNGYEPLEQERIVKSVKQNELSFCYTGQLYSGLSDASQLFYALSENCNEGKMSKENLRFYYAGKGFQKLYEQAETYGMESILVDMGYLDRREIQVLQASSDIFTVLSWNTHQAHGILTGKFYEGIRCGKPILAIISGDEANSELNIMNEKYHYGFCYEAANDAQDFENLKKWILSAYQAKVSGQTPTYEATPEFSQDFRYDNLAKRLDEIISSL